MRTLIFFDVNSRFRINSSSNPNFLVGLFVIIKEISKNSHTLRLSSPQRCVLPVFFSVDLLFMAVMNPTQKNWKNAPLCSVLINTQFFEYQDNSRLKSSFPSMSMMVDQIHLWSYFMMMIMTMVIAATRFFFRPVFQPVTFFLLTVALSRNECMTTYAKFLNVKI